MELHVKAWLRLWALMESRRPVLMTGPVRKDGMTVSSSTMRLMVGRTELEKLF